MKLYAAVLALLLAIEPPPDARKLCSGHVTGAPHPDGSAGPHITWTAYSSRATPASIAKRYRASLDPKAYAQKGACHLWRIPPDKPAKVLEVCPASADGPWRECEMPRDARSVILMSSIAGG